MNTPIVEIANYLDPALVVFLKSSERDGALVEMIDTLEQSGRLLSREAFYQAILEREKIVSTGIGMGVAIPHAKLPQYDNFFILIGVHKEGLEWSALDGNPVKLIFMIGGPDDKQTQYLKILSSLTLAIKDEKLRQKIQEMTTAQDIINLFTHSQ